MESKSRLRVLSIAVAVVLVGLLLMLWQHEARRVDVAASDPARAQARSLETPDLADDAARERSVADVQHVAEPPREPLVEEVPDATAADQSVVLLGTIKNSAGEVPPYTWVSWSKRDGSHDTTGPDALGNWTAGALEPATYDLVARTTHCFAQHRQVTLVPGEGEHRVDFVLEPMQRLRVLLLDSTGAPAVPRLEREVGLERAHGLEVHIVATSERPPLAFDDLAANPSEIYGIGNFWGRMFEKTDAGPEYIGTITIRERRPAWISLVLAQQVLATQYVSTEATEVVFTVDPEDVTDLACTLRAEFVDAQSGTPIAAKAEIAVLGNESSPAKYAAGADGRLDLAGLMPGKRIMVFHAEGYARVRKDLVLARGEVADLGRVELTRPVSIFGTMRDAAGAPHRSSVQWALFENASSEPIHKPPGKLTTTAEGDFEISGLVPGRYAVRIYMAYTDPSTRESVHEASDMVLVDTRAGDVHGVELRVAATTIVTIRIEGAVEPWPVATARNIDGVAVESCWVGFFGPTGVLQLLPGAYEIVVRQGGEELGRRNVVVEDEPVELEFDV